MFLLKNLLLYSKKNRACFPQKELAQALWTLLDLVLILPCIDGEFGLACQLEEQTGFGA